MIDKNKEKIFSSYGFTKSGYNHYKTTPSKRIVIKSCDEFNILCDRYKIIETDRRTGNKKTTIISSKDSLVNYLRRTNGRSRVNAAKKENARSRRSIKEQIDDITPLRHFSSNIWGFNFEEMGNGLCRLAVIFKDSKTGEAGPAYVYSDVPYPVIKKLGDAQSTGHAFYTLIRGKYKSDKYPQSR